MFKTSNVSLCSTNPDNGMSSGFFIHGLRLHNIGNMIFTHYIKGNFPPFPIIELNHGFQYFILGHRKPEFGEKIKFKSIEKYKLEDIIKKITGKCIDITV